MLRGCLIVTGILHLVAAAGAGVAGVPTPAVTWLLALGLIVSLGVLYERSRYQAIADKSPGPDWQATGERFIDPESGKLVAVHFKPATGERCTCGCEWRAQGLRRPSLARFQSDHSSQKT